MPNSICVRIFFGLNMPQGGTVSPGDWDRFEKIVLVKKLESFNVTESYGYWQGQKELSKVVTTVMDESEKCRAESVARIYCKTFGQDSVLVVVVPVTSFEFISDGDIHSLAMKEY